MKNLFGLNITNDEQNFHTDGEIFITKNIPPDIESRLDETFEQDTNFEKTANFPLWLSIIKYILIIGAITVSSGIFQSNVSFAEGYRNAPYLYWIAPLLWIAVISLILFEKSKAKKIFSSEDFSEHVENIVSVIQKAGQYLEIPEKSFDIDVLFFRYIQKNGEQKHKKFPFYSHINLPYKVYVKNGNLCLSNFRYIMEIPLQSIKSIYKEKQKVSFPNWNKDENFNSKSYKKFKIVCNNQGIYFAKYYSIQIQDIIGDFEFFVPNYDIDKLCSLTSLNIDEK